MPPKTCRFCAHGGELGAALVLGRPVSMQRVLSPAQDGDSDVSESDSDMSESERILCGLPPKGAKARACKATSSRQAPARAQIGLFSRLADAPGGVFSAVWLP